MKKILGLLLVFLFLLAGCGKSKPPYRIGVDPQWYSLDIQGRKKNLQGFTNDILKEIGASQKISIVVVSRNWDNLTDGLRSKNYDAMLSTIYPYVFNLDKYDFSDLFIPTGPVLVLPYNSTKKSLEDLKGKLIGFQRGSEAMASLQYHHAFIPRIYDSVPQAFNDVVNGNIDGAVVDLLTAQAFCQDLYNRQLKIVMPPFNDQGVRLLTLHGQNDNLLKQFNDGLRKLQKSGRYDELQMKWSLQTECPIP